MTGRHAPPPRPPRPRRRWALVALVVVVAAGAVAVSWQLAWPSSSTDAGPGAPPSGGQDPGPPGAPPMAFGVLGSQCDSDRVHDLYDAGVRYAEMGVDWSDFEPEEGSFDRDYQSEVEEAVDTCRRAGLGVVLTLGLNSAPDWVSDLPAGSYVDQGGHHGPDDVPNVVFSAAVRSAVSSYLTELDRVLDLGSLAAVRVGTGVNGELGYPGADTPTSNPYWAFDAAAQEGEGLAEGMSVSPMPDWNPGAATWRGAAVSADDAETWFRWYSGSVADAVVWVVRQLRDTGYTGEVHLPLAGRGQLPADLATALEDRLDGTDQRDGSLQAGLYYPEQLQRMSLQFRQTEQPGWGAISVDSTSVDDSTAVAARQLDPPQDSCRPEDATSDLLGDPDVEDWSSSRWTVANARAAGFPVVGENPGSPDLPGTGGDDDTDSSEQQMLRAPRYAQECGMTLFQWAFEDDLFSDDRAGLRAYVQQQRALVDGTEDGG